MLTEQISKLDCDVCRLKTEHYVLVSGDTPVMSRCLRCGRAQENPRIIINNPESYPSDNRKPVYVF